MERLVAEIGAKGLTVFARIDAAGAEEAGLALRPTEPPVKAMTAMLSAVTRAAAGNIWI